MLYRSSSGIYKILNNITEKAYVGSALYLIKRCIQHRYDLRSNTHRNKYLQASWNLHGEEAFEFLLIELVEDKEKLLEREQYWIDTLDCVNPKGYNANPKAGSKLGFKHSLETRIKIGKISRKSDKWPCAEGWLCKCSICKNTRSVMLKNWKQSRKLLKLKWLT